MKCKNHPKKEAEKTCVGCGNFFCSECLNQVKNRNYCKDCLAEMLSDKIDEEKESKTSQPQNIIIQQQQQQQQQETSAKEGKPRGSYCWLCFWIIVFFPAAILYFFIRRWD